MIIRQEESTPIGDFYHDSRIEPLFESIKSAVDEFEVDTRNLCFDIDTIVSRLKALKSKINSVEKEFEKSEYQKELGSRYNVD